MAGTNTANEPLPPGGPAVVLIRPQLGENIGACARAMLNCGLHDLRIVQPRDGWPDIKAIRAASGADIVLDNARLFDTTREAIADLTRTYATTARIRHLIKPEMGPRQAVADMCTYAPDAKGIGLLFGGERSGMGNEDATLADAIVTVPLNPAFSSLNLAQAVLVMSYEWRMAQIDETPVEMGGRAGEAAPRGVLHNFFDHIEGALEQAGFFTEANKKPAMLLNIRNMFARAALREQEVKILHGIVTALSDMRKDGRARREPGANKAEAAKSKGTIA